MSRDETTTVVSAQVPTETRAELERRAEANYRTISGEIRLAIDTYLSRAEAATRIGLKPTEEP